MSDQAKPLPLALLVCDQVYTDPSGANKRSLLGMFNSRKYPMFPTPPVPFWVFCSITEYTGRVPITLRIVDRDEERPPVFEVPLPLPKDLNPLFTVDFAMSVTHASFPEPGDYRVQILAEGMPIIERKLHVSLAPKRPPQPLMQ